MSRVLFSDSRPFGLRIRQTARGTVIERNGIAVEIATAELRFVLTALSEAAVEPLPLAPVASPCCSGCGSTGPCNAGCENRTGWEVAR
jgi:hypothetical protein